MTTVRFWGCPFAFEFPWHAHPAISSCTSSAIRARRQTSDDAAKDAACTADSVAADIASEDKGLLLHLSGAASRRSYSPAPRPASPPPPFSPPCASPPFPRGSECRLGPVSLARRCTKRTCSSGDGVQPTCREYARAHASIIALSRDVTTGATLRAGSTRHALTVHMKGVKPGWKSANSAELMRIVEPSQSGQVQYVVMRPV